MDKRLLHYFPPGTDTKAAMKNVIIWLSFAVACNIFVFSYRYYHAWESLYLNQIYRWVLRPDAQMPDFSAVSQGTLLTYLTSLLLLAGTALDNYRSFHRESVSSYVMRRIPDAKELHIRCLTVPLCAAALMTALMIALLFIERAVYIAFTPTGCLGDTSIDLFRILSMRG